MRRLCMLSAHSLNAPNPRENTTMHKVTLTPAMRAALAALNCWDIRVSDIEKLANINIGNLQIPVLRRGDMTAIVGGVKCGGAPNRFVEEFRQLSQQCAAILHGDQHAVIFVATFFHLRFEAIHPLVDSNGRLGRLLMAEQLGRTYAVDVGIIQDRLIALESEYRDIAVLRSAQEQFERLVRLIGRVVGVQIDAIPLCPYSLSPLFPESVAALEKVKRIRAKNALSPEPPAFKMRASVDAFSKAIKGHCEP